MFCNDNAGIQQVGGGGEVIQHQTEEQKEQAEIMEEDEDIKPGASDSASDTLSEQIRAAATDDGHSQSTNPQTGSSVEHKPPQKTHSGNSLESVQSITHGEKTPLCKILLKFCIRHLFICNFHYFCQSLCHPVCPEQTFLTISPLLHSFCNRMENMS